LKDRSKRYADLSVHLLSYQNFLKRFKTLVRRGSMAEQMKEEKPGKPVNPYSLGKRSLMQMKVDK